MDRAGKKKTLNYLECLKFWGFF